MSNNITLIGLLLELKQKNILRAIDYHFAVFIEKQCHDGLVCLTAALASNALASGHSCWEYSINPQQLLFNDETITLRLLDIIKIEKAKWLEHLNNQTCISSGKVSTPLVIKNNRIYLYKYWGYEQKINDWILASAQLKVDKNLLKKFLAEIFPHSSGEINWQKVAVAQACINRFTLITGGPGTGKTTTVANILLTLHKQQPEKILRVRLAAPTGKAATRINDSLEYLKKQIIDNDLNIDLISATTIHKLLGITIDQPQPKFSNENQLIADIVIVDEASMLDLELTAQLVDALPTNARLILVGDPYQLPSIAPGNVIADICNEATSFELDYVKLLEELTNISIPIENKQPHKIANYVARLKVSYRFKDDSPVGELSQAVKSQNITAIYNCLAKDNSQVTWYINEQNYVEAINLAVKKYKVYFEILKNSDDPQEIITAFNKFRLLCVVREGNSGVKYINNEIEYKLRKAGLIEYNSKTDRYYRGKPIIINRNDHVFGLSNGDIGIVLLVKNSLQVVFLTTDGKTCNVPLLQLGEHEAAYAMTVHKSQGSEFDEVALLLQTFNTVLTNELLYTGITRLKNKLSLFAKKEVLEFAISNYSNRVSGLGKSLYKTST